MLEVSDASWREDVLQADDPVVVMFWAPWNGGCKQYRPIFEALGERFEGQVRFASMNMDEHSQVPTSLNVRTLPSTALVERGEMVLLVPGVKTGPELTELISTHFGRSAAAEEVEHDVNDDTWQALVAESPLPVMVDFWAPWCPPCRMQGPIFEEFAGEQAGKIRCLKLNTDEATQTASRLGIRNIPAILLFAAGEEVGRAVGVRTLPQLRQLAADHFAPTPES